MASGGPYQMNCIAVSRMKCSNYMQAKWYTSCRCWFRCNVLPERLHCSVFYWWLLWRYIYV